MLKSLRYHESKQRGSLDFPLDYHYVDERHARYEMPYHWHEEFEILQVRSGEFRLTLDDTVHRLRAGDVAFIPAGCLHGGEPLLCTYECIVFDMRLLLKSNDHCKEQVGDVLHGRIAVKPHFTCGDKVIRHTIPPLFDALREQSPGYALITLGCLFQFLGEVYKYGSYTQARSPQSAEGKKTLQLKKVFELIEEGYAENLTLHQLAGAVHMTPKYFCRFFKEATHRTPMDYLAYYRVEMACYQMAATDKNVTQIAMDTGYASLNYFIRTFKQHKGVTPGQYMKAMRSGRASGGAAELRPLSPKGGEDARR